MMDELKQSKQAGTFAISPGKDIYGELTLAGRNTSLYLRDKEFFNTLSIPDQCVKGVLHNLTKVTLIKCMTREALGSGTRGGENYRFASIFPHYVVLGDQHINPNEETITEVHFVVDDASTLFSDFDAFSLLIDARPFIEQIVHANGFDREIKTGPHPEILYFTGKHEIFAAETVLGRISASHNPSHNFGGSDGVFLKNTIFVAIAFPEALTFDKAIYHMSTLFMYLEMLVGRPQNLLKWNLRVRDKDAQPISLQVYMSMPPKRDSSYEEQKPHSADILLDAVQQPDVFSSVLKNWLDRHGVWHDARQRFSNSFQQQYSVDRLISSANMFDILPDSAVPSKVELPQELECAKKDCHLTFKNLPDSIERTSVLDALSRVGKSFLKHKIRHRGLLLNNIVGERFPDIFKVTDAAVDCRNHYVHGSKPLFDYSKDFAAVIFFIDTLEFIFATSDLIEAGWDVKAWCESSMTMSHPFTRYRATYVENLQKLRCYLP